MSMTVRDRAKKAVLDARKLADDVYGKAQCENRTLTPGEKAMVDDAIADAKTIVEYVRGGDALDQLTKGMGMTGGLTGGPFGGGHDDGGDMEHKSMGEQFTESEEFKNALTSGLTKARSWTTGAVEVKATLTPAVDSGGGLLNPDVRPSIVPLPCHVSRSRTFSRAARP